jgi:two-component system CheB/CheR fusion protein
VVLVFHNIEDRRRLERELRQQADELQRADRQKNEFLAMLAHELRNPMAPINNALQVLRQDPDESQSQNQKQGRGRDDQREADLAWAIEIMSRQIRHMARLVDDLLDVSRITRGKIALRRELVVLKTLVAHALESVQPLIAEKHHELTVALPEETLVLNADPARLEQVLCNLLNNAAKYTNEGGRIQLVATVEDQGRTLALRVRDNGIGIAREVLPSVFELFRQADRSLDRSQGGLGIGLTLVHNLVELHGGSVEAASGGIGKGSEFTVRLPLVSREWPVEGGGGEKEPLIPRSAPHPPRATHRGRRILVVDDIPDSAESLARLLRRWGHEVSMAHDGPSALAAARSTSPEVVLLDIGLPGMDGYEVARQLRLDPDCTDTVLVALTGYGQSSDRHQTRDAGFDQHLIKPVDTGALRELLATIEPRANRRVSD